MASQTLTPQETLRWTRIGMLAALAMLLGYLETFVPIPIPGVKLGLANIAILIALAQGDIGGAFGIATIKVLASGLLFGSPITMAYSAVGTLFAFALMAPLSRIPGMHVVALSVVGAVAHEIGQLFVAMLLLGTPLVWLSAPMLLVAGCVTGTLCGVVAASTVALLQRGEDAARRNPTTGTPEAGTTIPSSVAGGASGTGRGGRAISLVPNTSIAASTVASLQHGEHESQKSPDSADETAPAVPSTHAGVFDGRVALVGFVVYCVVALHASTPWALAACLGVALVGCAVGHVRLRDAVRALRPMLFIVLVTLIAQVASTQHGVVLASLGPVRLTQEALIASATLLVRLLALTLASLALMHLASLESLVEAIAWLLRPLGRLGLHTEGFVLALQSALRFLPTLAAAMGDNATLLRTKLGTRELWTDVLPQLIAQLYREAGV